MVNKIRKRLLVIAPIAILIIMLFFVNYSVNYFKDSIYTFIYNAHIDSTQIFSQELGELISEGDNKEENSQLYFGVINAYNKTLGGKYAIISFILDENANIYHSNDENENYISELLKYKNNENLINQTAATHNSGNLNLNNDGKEQPWFYQVITDGSNNYYLFMSVDKDLMAKKTDANEIIIPICVIGLLLLICVEYNVWLRSVQNDKKSEVN